jgi:hypothetical protein
MRKLSVKNLLIGNPTGGQLKLRIFSRMFEKIEMTKMGKSGDRGKMIKKA